ncbi:MULTISPECIES: D-amino-acid transaminase [unclassified Paenibacillus]|uniref:D-amino-acid transaminase n=1 Tax=unclassified Paenibacillus TaxID=185978 RepID=UPI00020D75C4|nr:MULTISPECIES: D-amino-acid transaminase [unclassified Paenibacillus]EGL16875.1 D-amino-acid transaminase [Paenibacillus sp. HGF7]EPD81870.1 D-amino-acid transaminase [Paenibacillus sp. HGH0039]
MMLFGNQLVPDEEVRVSPLDRGYYFGDGVYEVFRIYDGRLFEVQGHMERFKRSMAEVRIGLPYPLEELENLLNRLTEAAGIPDGLTYVQITRGAAPRSHPFPAAAEPVVTGWCSPFLRPLKDLENGISAIVREDIRWHRCDIKSLNLLPNVLLKQEALDGGAGEVIFNRGGVITEASASNVMIVKDGIVRTHPADHHILRGVTRSLVIRLAEGLGIAVREEAFRAEELASADEVFITSTGSEVMPVVLVDSRPVGDGKPGPVTRRLQQAFEAAIPAGSR